MAGKKISKNKITKFGVVKAINIGGLLTTLGMWTTFNDPFGPVKLSFVLLTAAWLIGHLIIDCKILFLDKVNFELLIILVFFLCFMSISLFFTKNKITGLIGETQRNNGFLLYFGLCIIMLASAVYFKFSNIYMLVKTVLFLGFTLSVYGIGQSNGFDIVKWNNPYNSVIATVGNPNFAAAIIAILASFSFGIALNNQFRVSTRLSGILVVLLSLSAIYLSDARQGLLGSFIGIGFILVVFIYIKNKKLGLVVSGFGVVGLISSVLGILQIGPLAPLIYKESVSVRGFYWRAGIEMTRANPLTGVGIDSYGSYFKQYADQDYSLRYGFEITSNNAHNVPIQFFSTGGAPLGLTYLLLIGFIFWRSIIGIKKFRNSQLLLFTSIVSGWLVYQATSLISIDSPAIALWGWILGGIIIALSNDSQVSASLKSIQSTNSVKTIDLKQSMISMSLLVCTLIFSLILFRTETNLFYLRSIYNPDSQENSKLLREGAIKNLNLPLVNQAYKAQTASYLVNSGFVSEGLSELKEIAKFDERNEAVLDLLANYYFQLNEIELAVKSRESITRINPWNARNLLQLGLLYKLSGKIREMNEVKEKIMSFAASTNEGKQAIEELVG
jgi:O-antigen ligase